MLNKLPSHEKELNIMEEEFYRISRLPPYVFAEINKMKAAKRAAGRDIIDLGMGNPDSPPPRIVIDKLIEAVKNPRSHGYSVSKGIPGLRKAVAGYYKRRFGVELDPENEICVTQGSKEGLSSLATAMIKPGDVIMTPNPTYPVHMFGFIIAGATVWSLDNVVNEPGLIGRLKKAVDDCSPKPVALILNFPGNPTSEVVGLDFYKEAVEFCREKGIYIISDLAYSEIYFDENNPPPSILQIPGAKDIAVEFTSMSKTYSMAGWRIGFACGNKKLVASLAKIKSYIDYGSFTPIQVAACSALNEADDYIKKMREVYKERRDIVVNGLRKAGWDVPCPSASMFIWTKLPEKFSHMTSVEFAKFLIENADVAVSPGNGFGKNGEGYVRIALVENKQRLRQAVRNIKEALKKDA